MIKKKHIKTLLISLLIIVSFLLAGSYFLTQYVSDQIKTALTEQNLQYYRISIDKTKFSLFDRSLLIRNVHFAPKDSAMLDLKNGKLELNKLHLISIQRFKIKGIDLWQLARNNKIKVREILFDNPVYQQIYNPSIKEKKVSGGKRIRLDSIAINDIEGVSFDRLNVDDLQIQIIDVTKEDMDFHSKPLSFDTSGFALQEVGDQVFSLFPTGDAFTMSKISLSFPKISYRFGVKQIAFDYVNNDLHIEDLKFEPTINKVRLANTYPYNTEVYTTQFKDIKIHNFNLESALLNEGFFMDSISIDGLSVDIYKDKRKPFNLGKKPKLPHNALKHMDLQLHIPVVSIYNSKLIYQEKMEKESLLMTVHMDDLSTRIKNVSSVDEASKDPLTIDLRAKFMGKSDLQVNFVLPLSLNQDRFYFSGMLESSDLKLYDKAIIPALGLKVLEGRLDHLSFQGSANNTHSKGTLKMLYHDLEAEVFKTHSTEKNNFLSWSVNNLVYHSNPGPNGKEREAVMEFERVMYKGFGNFVWKSIQSGIVNTIAPFGMTKEKEENKKRRKEKREERRRKKRERKEEGQD